MSKPISEDDKKQVDLKNKMFKHMFDRLPITGVELPKISKAPIIQRKLIQVPA